ncbi:MAG: methyltransferase regulatory domain-containing protein [Gammaproteobacteria bacterium]|nr:methyltransferase regulatory domain-containing protein [Gammaproteobacteria bacterium]
MSDSYDDIPYQSIPFTDTHPENLAMLGRLFGLNTPDPARARVLELGCASGGNLLPLAFYLPEGRYLGVELSARQVQDGQRLIAAVGLDNIRIEQGDILTLDNTLGDTLGEFDYIIAHGVYSWVPPAVQTRILDICARHLAPHGIAYISYNTWPGWHMRWTLRELLLRYTHNANSPGERLARAQRLLEDFPAALDHSDTLPTQFLQGEIARLREAHPSYLYHEYLESINQPQYVREFIASAERHGLQYVCDADLKSMFPSVLGEVAEQWLDQFEDVAEHEQYLDFLVNRSFRQSLLCRADAPLSREIELEKLTHYAFYASLRAPDALDLRSAAAQSFLLGKDKPIQVDHPLTKAALVTLNARYPDAVAYVELADTAAEQVHAAGNPQAAADRNALLTELFMLFVHQAVGITPMQRRFHTALDTRPRAHRLAHVQTMTEIGHLATARHSTILLDAFSARLIGYLDGTRDTMQLTTQLTDDILEHRLMLPNLQPVTAETLHAQVEANVQRFLKLFARTGILASPQMR